MVDTLRKLWPLFIEREELGHWDEDIIQQFLILSKDSSFMPMNYVYIGGGGDGGNDSDTVHKAFGLEGGGRGELISLVVRGTDL